MIQATIKSFSEATGVPVDELVQAHSKMFPHRPSTPSSLIAFDLDSRGNNEARRLLSMAGHKDKADAFNPQAVVPTAFWQEHQKRMGSTAPPNRSMRQNSHVTNNSGVIRMNSVNAYDQQSTEQWARQQWENDAELRAEFSNDRAAWLAYAHADAQGFCKTTGMSR